MPTTFNGIGTHYYGKTNLETRRAICPHCQREAELRSYDTRLCFCIIFVPLIPLGRKRVIDDCSVCRQHGVVEAGKWEELRGDVIREATAEFEASPNDPEKAVALHATLNSGGEREAANQLADLLAERFADNLDVQVYLGVTMEELGEIEQSNERFHRAYEIDRTNPTSQHVSAAALLREGDAIAARGRLAELEESGERADPALSFAVASKMQEQNDSQAAGELLRKLGETVPGLRRNKEFRKLAKQVELSSGAAPGTLATVPALWEKPTFWWSVAALALAAALVGYDHYRVNNQSLYIVNGLSRPIRAAIDQGEPVRVRSGGSVRLQINSGEHRAEVIEPAAHAGESHFTVSPGRFGLWFGRPVHVVDPTRSAVVLWEETVYSDKPVDGENEYRLEAGQLFTSFDHADYAFKNFPQQIEVKGSGDVTKSRVALVEIDAVSLVINDPERIDHPETLDYLEAHLVDSQGAENLYSLYGTTLTRQGAIPRGVAFLKKRLDVKPVDVSLHRSYQQLAELSGEQNLPKQYDELLAESPADPGLLYLRGRLENYHPQANAFFDRALAADSDHVMALIGKSYGKATIGAFDEAIELVDRALLKESGNVRAMDLRYDLLVALDRQAELERELSVGLEAETFNFGASTEMMKSLASRGRIDLATETHEKFVTSLQSEWPDDPNQLRVRSGELLKRLEGDYEAAAQLAQDLMDQEQRQRVLVHCAILGGRAAEATGFAAELPKHEQAVISLWACLVYTTRGDLPAAELERRKAAEAFQASGGSLGEAGVLLADGIPTDQRASRAVELEFDILHKAALLLVVADQVGEAREPLVELAKRLAKLPGDYRPVLQAALKARDRG